MLLKRVNVLSSFLCKTKSSNNAFEKVTVQCGLWQNASSSESSKAHNQQKWEKILITCPRHKLNRIEAVCLENFNCTSKISIIVNMRDLGQFLETIYLNKMKIACFHHFLRKNPFLPTFYTQNDNFSIFEGMLTLWRHSDVIH